MEDDFDCDGMDKDSRGFKSRAKGKKRHNVVEA